MKNEIKVFAPASVTNVSCGFDIMGFALNWPGDELILRIKDEPGIVITKITGDDNRLPFEALNNTAGLALDSMVNYLNFEKGLEIEIHKKMALGTGMGSSAASAVAAVFAFNEILDKPFTKDELLKFALDGEKLTCGGNPHADNVAACLYGGFIVVRSLDPIDIITIETPDNLFVTVIHPYIVVRTAETRKMLKKEILLKDAVQQWGNVAGLVAGLMKKDFELIGRSLQDVIIEPVRSILIPGYDKMKEAAIQAGAIGCGISGSGPSVFAFSKSLEQADEVGTAMRKILDNLGVENDIYLSPINKQGPKVI